MKEDRDKLIEFLETLRTLMREDRNYLDPDLRQRADDAWSRIEDRFDILESELETPRDVEKIDESLERSGLTGAELDLKLFAFNRAVAEYRAERRRWSGRLKDWARKVFGWFGRKWRSFAALILSSLAEATGAAGPIREANDVFGIALDD